MYIYIYIHTYKSRPAECGFSSWLTPSCAQAQSKTSQSFAETFPCTGYKAVSLKGEALRENHVARVGI